MSEFHVKDSGSWKEILEFSVKDAGGWKSISDAYVKDSGTWKLFFTGTFTFNKTISSNTANYNLRSDMISNGWDEVAVVEVTVTINAGVRVYSTSISTPAFDMGGSFPGISTIDIINNGTIQGAGGDGGIGGDAEGQSGFLGTPPTIATAGNGTSGQTAGTAFKATHDVTIDNNNTIEAGGGGGGGGGGAATAYTNGDPKAPTESGSSASGGGAGGGSGHSSGVGSGAAAGTASGPDNPVNGTAGANGTNTSGGAAGGGAFAAGTDGDSSTSGAGGPGGGPGVDGSSGFNGSVIPGAAFVTATGSGAAGGLRGFYTEGFSNITWESTGTRLGRTTG